MRDFVAGFGEQPSRVGQLRRLASLFMEAKRGRQIAKCFPSALSDIGLANSGEFLEKLQHRSVVKRLTADPPASSPRGNDNAGNPKPGTNRRAVDVFSRSIRRRCGRDDVIEKAVVLIVVEDEHRLSPDVRVVTSFDFLYQVL